MATDALSPQKVAPREGIWVSTAPQLTIRPTLEPLLRHLLFPASCGAVVYAKGREDGETDLANKESGLKIRARELPLYVEDDLPKSVPLSNKSETKSLVEETISCIRQEFQILVSQANVIKDEVDEAAKKASAKTEETLRYLRTPENAVQRYGAVALGGSAGYILGLRKNLFKRLLYTAGGASLMAALCYPREAKELSDELLVQVKKYFVIGYHFANGVCGDLFGFQLPPLPIGHLVISDKPHPPPEAVPSSAHLLPPTATPTHIPLPSEDPHSFEIKKVPKK